MQFFILRPRYNTCFWILYPLLSRMPSQ